MKFTKADFAKKEQALQEALEYLEELQRDQAGEDLLGDSEGASGDLLGTAGSASGAPADLLGFGGDQISVQPQTDVFSMPASTPTITSNASVDLLGFGGLASPSVQSSATAFSSPNTREQSAPSTAVAQSRQESSTNQLRPSIFTANGPSNHQQQIRVTQQPQHLVEEDEAEQARKMQMADGLFAGVGASGPSASSNKTIMSSGYGNSNMSALDELIPSANTTLSAPFSSMGSTTDSFAALSAPTLGEAEPSTMTAPQPLDNVFSVNSDQQAPGFGMGPMGGSCDSNEMPPPPPPMLPPPPPVSATPSINSIGGFQQGYTNQTNNASFEQMQELIRHQQQQMDQMMAMMQQMKTGGGQGS